MKKKSSYEKVREVYFSNPYRLPPECDNLCLLRPCLNKYEDKGSFSAGRGYTSCSKGFNPACSTRLCNGCPNTGNSEGDRLSVVRAYEILGDPDSPKGVTATIINFLKGRR